MLFHSAPAISSWSPATSQSASPTIDATKETAKFDEEAALKLTESTGTTVTVNAIDDPFSKDDSPENKALVRRMDRRIVPLSASIYLLCYLDRSNIGNARVMNSDTGDSLQQELGIDGGQYRLALMLFLVAYALFEVPSNYFLKRVSPSRWIAFLMLCWGAVTIGIGGTHSFGSLTVCRFMLGMFEAGLFPGLVYYLTFWYRANERSLRVALILASATLGGAFGGAIAYGISHMNQTAGISSWRWLFFLEGAPSCLSAVLVFFFLPDYPETAKWLSPEEKKLAADRLAFNGSHGGGNSLTWREAKKTLTDWRLYVHYLIYFGISSPFSSLSLFTPSLTAGLGYTALRAQLMTVPPWSAAYVCTVLTALSADHFNARALHAAGAMVVASVGFLASACLPADAFGARYACLIIACSGAFSAFPPLLCWLSANLGPEATAATGLAIALNVSFGAPGQIVGVWIYKDDEKTRGYPTGHWTNLGLTLMSGVLTIGLWWWYRRENQRIRRQGAAGGNGLLWKL